jgi:hypothetical protein
MPAEIDRLDIHKLGQLDAMSFCEGTWPCSGFDLGMQVNDFTGRSGSFSELGSGTTPGSLYFL